MTPGRQDFEFRSKWAVDTDEIMRQFNARSPTIIHFSGHGGPGAGIRIHHSNTRDVVPGSGGSGSATPPDATDVHAHAFAEMIRTAAPRAAVVVLNACYSDAMADALLSAVPCVVGIQGPIDDNAARVFSAGFYRALGHGHPVSAAVEQATAALMVDYRSEAYRPVCRVRNGIDPARWTPESCPAAHQILGLFGDIKPGHPRDELFAAAFARYSVVVRAARDFKDLGHELLIHTVMNHAFQTFAPAPDWRKKLSRYAPESELYLSIALPGRFGDEACKLEVGFWWREDRVPVVYAGAHQVSWGRNVEPVHATTKRDVTSTAYLMRDATGATLGAAIEALLAELEEAARRARPA